METTITKNKHTHTHSKMESFIIYSIITITIKYYWFLLWTNKSMFERLSCVHTAHESITTIKLMETKKKSLQKKKTLQPNKWTIMYWLLCIREQNTFTIFFIKKHKEKQLQMRFFFHFWAASCVVPRTLKSIFFSLLFCFVIECDFSVERMHICHYSHVYIWYFQWKCVSSSTLIAIQFICWQIYEAIKSFEVISSRLPKALRKNRS